MFEDITTPRLFIAAKSPKPYISGQHQNSKLIYQACLQLPHQYHQQEAQLCTYVDQRIENIISYIENNLGQTLNLSDIANAFSMSVSNLQRRFKQEFNMTVNGYIRHRRLNIARQHLQLGLVSITEAAYEAGYLYPSNFTHAFRKEFGFAPHKLGAIEA